MAKDKEFEYLYGVERKRRTAARKEKRKLKKGSTTVCPHCGNDVGHYVAKVINPYYYEINGTEIWDRMCRDCYESACEDI
jgi:hypothetical protein